MTPGGVAVLRPDAAPAERATTDDALLGGQVSYRQPARGYRVGLEAPLLAAFARPPGRRPPRTIIDLGSGPGAVGLCLAWRLPAARLTLIERDPFHAELARHNLARNGLGERGQVIEGEAIDSDAALGRGVADLVVSNPPWFDRSSGQPAATGATREAARGLTGEGFVPFCRAARQLLGRGGRCCLTAPASALTSLLEALAAAGLVAKRMRWLHPRRAEPATAFFVEALAARPGGLVVEPPWFVRGDGEEYTDDLRALLWGRSAP